MYTGEGKLLDVRHVPMFGMQKLRSDKIHLGPFKDSAPTPSGSRIRRFQKGQSGFQEDTEEARLSSYGEGSLRGLNSVPRIWNLESRIPGSLPPDRLKQSVVNSSFSALVAAALCPPW